MTAVAKVAMIGSGDVGTDLMTTLLGRFETLDVVAMVGFDPGQQDSTVAFALCDDSPEVGREPTPIGD